MSNMNELSVDYDAWEQHVEHERQVLRLEGAEELRQEILRQLDEALDVIRKGQQITSELDTPLEQYKQGLYAAQVSVAKASI